jgi:D-alanine-D-alanine ligase-like ATP-grasp enzyme
MKKTFEISLDEAQNFPFLLKHLIEVCKSQNYQIDIIDRNLIKVSLTKSFFAGANGDIGINPINPHFACELVNDKARTIQILKKEGFRTPAGRHFFVSGIYSEKGKRIEDVFDYARTLGFPVFVRPNRLCGSKFAGAVYSEKKLEENIHKIAKVDTIALVQEAVHLPEYRIVSVDGEFQYSCKKVIPRIIGDGVKTIRELIRDFNAKLRKNIIKKDSHFIMSQLREKKLNIHSILEQGDVWPVASTAVLRIGGAYTEYCETISDATTSWLKKISDIFQLRVIGIDVFSEGSINNPENLIIIEINHNPGHKACPVEKAQNIIKTVCQKYFNECDTKGA